MMRTRNRTRSIIALAVIGAFPSGVARAADDTVKIGADTRSGQETSSLLCWFDHRCHGELKELGLQVDIDVRRAMYRIARLRLRGNSRGCCTFEYGRGEIAIDLHAALHREPIFKSKKIKAGITVENERMGSLYLNFLVSPDLDDRKGLERSI